MTAMKELIRFRSYIWSSVRREFKLRFRGSVLGASLVFITPALQITIYALVFGSLLKGRLPGNTGLYAYPIYLCAGLLLWNLFADIVQRSQNMYLENANLIKKTNFPLSALAMVNGISCSLTWGLSMTLLLAFLMTSSLWPGSCVWLTIPVAFSMVLLALALGRCLSILQVFFRDFSLITPLALQSLFWCSPIVYPLEVLPAFLQPWLALNPFYAPLASVQAALLGTALPEATAWFSTVVAIVLLWGIGQMMHRQLRADMLDQL
jgi:lipopolysaccharide transport system permease protein